MCAFLGITTDRMRIVGGTINKRRILAESYSVNVELLDNEPIGNSDSGYDKNAVFSRMEALTK